MVPEWNRRTRLLRLLRGFVVHFDAGRVLEEDDFWLGDYVEITDDAKGEGDSGFGG